MFYTVSEIQPVSTENNLKGNTLMGPMAPQQVVSIRTKDYQEEGLFMYMNSQLTYFILGLRNN